MYIYIYYICVFVCSSLVMPDSAAPWTVAHQAPLSLEFSRQEYWSEVPFPSLGGLPKLGIEPVSLVSPALAGGFFTSAIWEAHILHIFLNKLAEVHENHVLSNWSFELEPA